MSSTIIYRDDTFVLGMEDGYAYLLAKGKKYGLTCHPYEPCLYISDERGASTAVHNSFDPDCVLESFAEGRTVTSITGFEYDARDFCLMVEYAAGRVDIQIDDAERVFGNRAKKKSPAPCPPKESMIIEDETVSRLIAEYPDCVIDYCLVKNDHAEKGRKAHRQALLQASRKLFFDAGELIWNYDLGKADAIQISVENLFAPLSKDGILNYRKAFLAPPYQNSYTDKDFDKVNSALFPNGTDELEVYQWTSGWSEYFDDGHEWWGALCLTVYDSSLDRFVVILASATD